MPSNITRKLFDNRDATKARVLHGRVTSAPVDATGRNSGYVTATVAGQPNVTVLVDRDGPHYASYDHIEVVQDGDAANAVYYARRRIGGGRPSQNITQFVEDATYGDAAYAAGDIAIGDVTGTEPVTVITSGCIGFRDINNSDVIALVSSTCSITVGNTARPNVVITPTRMSLKAVSTERIRLDSSGSGFLASNNINWDTAGNFHVQGNASIGGWDIGAASIFGGTGASYTGMYSGTDASIPAFWSGGSIPATAPFRAYRDGRVYASNASISGCWLIGTASLVSGTGASLTGMYSGSDATTPAFWSGGATPSTASFRAYRDGRVYANSGCFIGQINATSGCFTGQLNATSGCLGTLTVTGILTAGSGATTIKIDGSSGCVGTSDFLSGVSGWRIAPSTAEFNNITARGSIRTPVFVKDLIEAHAGTLIVAKSAGKITGSGYTVGSTLVVEDPPGTGWLFETNDICRIKGEYSGGIGDTWITVTRTATENQYTTASNSGTNGIAYPAGVAAVDYGPSGQGFNLITGDLTNAPYYSIQTHAGAPWTTTTERVRLGNLTGLAAPATGYGLWTDNGYFTGHLKANSGSLVDLSISGSLTIDTTGGIYQGTGTFATPTTGLKIWNSGGASSVGRIVAYAGGASQVGFGTDGKFYGGSGSVIIDASGISITGLGLALRNYGETASTILYQVGTQATFYTDVNDTDSKFAVNLGGSLIGYIDRQVNSFRINGGISAGSIATTMPNGSLKISGSATIEGGLNTGTCTTATAGVVRASSAIYTGNTFHTVGTVYAGSAVHVSDTLHTTSTIYDSGGLNVGTCTTATAGIARVSGAVYAGGIIYASDDVNAAGVNIGACTGATTGQLRSAAEIFSGGDIRTSGGLTVGNTTNDAATGTIVAAGSANIGGGLTVGSLTTNATGGMIITASDIRVGGGLYVGNTATDVATGMIFATDDIRTTGEVNVGSVSAGAGDGTLSTTNSIYSGGGLGVGSTATAVAAGIIAATGDVRLGGGLCVGSSTTDIASGTVFYTGSLIAYQSSANRRGYIRVPVSRYDILSVQLRGGTGNDVFYLSTATIPKEAIAADCTIAVRGGGDQSFYFLGNALSGNNQYQVGQGPFAAGSTYNYNTGTVNTLAGSTEAILYGTWDAKGGTMEVSVLINGYYI